MKIRTASPVELALPSFFASLFLLGAGCSHAAPPVPVAVAAPQAGTDALPAGVPMVPGDAIAAFSFSGTPEQGNLAVAPVTGQPFPKATRFTVSTKPAETWAVQANVATTGTVKKGDVLLASFYIRAIKGQAETGEVRTQFTFEQNGAPWTKITEREVSAGKEWKRIDIPFEIRGDAPASTHACFRLGYAVQTLEIGGFTLTNYGTSVPLDKLPRTRTSYKGVEPDAAWRTAANERIEKLRKGDIRVVVRNASGKPVPNANISLAQTRHAFAFGTAVAAKRIEEQSADGDKYRAWVQKYCSKVVIENDLKWGGFEQDPARAVRVVKWFNDRGIPVRGHNLVWPSFGFLPGDIKGLSGDKVKLAKRVDDHITQEVSALKGQIVDWDVVNEPYKNHDLQDILGADSLTHWFKLTRSLDPKPRLTLNDYPPLDGSATSNDHLNAFYKTLETLKTSGAPIGGIGFQCHFGANVIAPENLLTGLDRFSKLGLPITLTEFDINTNDEALQTAYMRDFMTATFSHPAVDGIIMWGFWENQHWLPDAALFKSDWTIKPNGVVFQDLVRKTWWTNTGGVTGDKGTWGGRGFYGDYDLVVTLPSGAKKTVPVKLTKGAKNEVVVTM